MVLDEPARAALERGISGLEVDEVWSDASLPGLHLVLVDLGLSEPRARRLG